MTFLKYLHVVLGGVCGLMWLSTAFADTCNSLDQNPAWTEGFQELSKQFKSEDFKSALKSAYNLEAICDQSPILNYTIARIHKNLNDDEKYLYYLQKATQNTEKFGVDKNMLDRMWSEKYIAAHPEADPEVIKARDTEINSLKQELAKTHLALEEANSKVVQIQNRDDSIRTYRTWLWAGVGIGTAGLAMTITGTVLYLNIGKDDIDKDDIGKRMIQNKDISAPYAAGIGLLGAGIGLTIVGSIVAGVFGYKYSHSELDSPISLTLSPTQSSIVWRF